MRSTSRSVVQEREPEPTFIEAARRAQIIGCAIDAIAELGYERASLAEIAKRAKVSKSVISYYFAGKEQLIRQVVASVYAEGSAFKLPRIRAQSNATDALRAYIRTNIEYMDGHRNHMRALVEIVSSYRDDDGRSMFDASAQDQVIAELAALLKLGQDAGLFRAFSTKVMAVAIRAAIDALPHRLSVDPGIDLDRYAQELSELFERAVAASRAPKQRTMR